MENTNAILKLKINQAKTELEKKTHQYISKKKDTIIDLNYSCYIKEIIFNNTKVDDELILEINSALKEAKMKMEEEYFTLIRSLGIKI